MGGVPLGPRLCGLFQSPQNFKAKSDPTPRQSVTLFWEVFCLLSDISGAQESTQGGNYNSEDYLQGLTVYVLLIK